MRIRRRRAAGARCPDGEDLRPAPVSRTGDGTPVHPVARPIRAGASRSVNLWPMASSRSAGGLRRVRSLVALVLAVPAFLLVFAGSASAASQDGGEGDIGDVHSPASQSLPVMLALYVGIPALGFLVAYLLSLRSGRKTDRYRPGTPWRHEAAWFGSSEQESREVQEQRRRAALPGAGGASGQW